MGTGPTLFTPLRIRGVTLRNRVVVSPMLTYSAQAGYVNDWHLVHLGKFAIGGSGLVFMESTKVDFGGLTTPNDCGLWKDDFVPGLRRITGFVKSHGAAAGIQLGHSGRKARNSLPWQGRAQLPSPVPDVEHGEDWELVAPSPLPAGVGLESPRALTIPEIHNMVAAWGAAARRADEAGFDVLEVHGAHGYLIHQFLSPSANQRTDRYGGSPTNRMRFAVEVVEEIRRHWPADKPLFFRVSAVDEDGGTLEATITLSRLLHEAGVDVIDCSSGGMPRTGPQPPVATSGYGYQVPYADQIRREAGIATMAVGLIIHADQAEKILNEGSADLVALGREMLHNPNWTFDAADKLGMDRPYHGAPDAYGYWLEKRRHGGAELITELLTRPSTWQPGIETASSVPT